MHRMSSCRYRLLHAVIVSQLLRSIAFLTVRTVRRLLSSPPLPSVILWRGQLEKGLAPEGETNAIVQLVTGSGVRTWWIVSFSPPVVVVAAGCSPPSSSSSSSSLLLCLFIHHRRRQNRLGSGLRLSLLVVGLPSRYCMGEVELLTTLWDGGI